MRNIPVLLISLSLLLSNFLSGQGNPLQKHKENKILKIKTKGLKSANFFSTHKEQLGLSSDDQMVFERSYVDKYNYTRLKFKQLHKGLPVIGSTYTLHQDNEEVFKATGNIFPYIKLESQTKINIDDLKISAGTMLEKALIQKEAIVDLDFVEWEVDYNRSCIIDKSYPEISGQFAVAYEFIVSTFDYEIPIKQKVYVNASSGKLINHFSIIKCGSVKGKALTRYYGEVDITTDSVAPNKYLLRDFTRGDGIITLDYNTDQDTFVDTDNFWDNFNDDNDEVAGDAHYCTTKYYDMMLEYFGWNGLDNQGGELVSIVHTRGKYYVNAYWNGSNTNYGNGDCHRYGPLTTMTIVGHEFAHGWTDKTSDLVYRNESGALNESISDIIGKGLENYADKENFSWLIGDRIRLNESINYFRNMADPVDRRDPKYYGGEHWYTGIGDNGGVHSNSGVFNYWFYLLVEGVSGVNEKGVEFNVNSIGMADALDVVFATQIGYLTENSTYLDCMYYSLEAVIDLFGENSLQHQAVLEAWKAVGLYPGINDLDLSIELVENEIAICPDETKEVEVIIRNVGQQTFSSNKSILISYDDDINPVTEEVLELTNDLMAGDSIAYTLTSALLTQESTRDIVVSLVDVDENILNNSVEGDIDASDINGMDLELRNFAFAQDDNCTNKIWNRYTYSISNLGCQVVPEGENYYFDIETNVGDFTVERRVFANNNPGDFQGGSGSLINENIPEGITDFEVTLRVVDDVNEENNKLTNTSQFSESIEEGYREYFSEDFDGNKFTLDYNDTYYLDSIVDFDGNRMFSITRLPKDRVFDDCNDPEGFFDGYDFKADMTFCVDAMDMEQPIFEFNLIQLLNRNRALALPNEDFGAMVKVVSDSMSYPVIFGQNSGELKNHSFDLPSNYKGEINIEVMLESANEDAIYFLDDKDAVLFDDFKLYDKSTYNPNYDRFGYVVYPNPTSQELRISSNVPEKNFDVWVFDSIGQLILEMKDARSETLINLIDQPTGIYFVSFVEHDYIVTTHRIVKL